MGAWLIRTEGRLVVNRGMWRGALVAMVLVVMLVVPLYAEAGCLGEHSECRKCARQALRRSVWRLDLGGIRDANIAMWDCDIDLYHCVLLGSHHDFACAL